MWGLTSTAKDREPGAWKKLKVLKTEESMGYHIQVCCGFSLGDHMENGGRQKECEGPLGGERVPGSGLEGGFSGNVGVRQPPTTSPPGHTPGRPKKKEHLVPGH